MVIWQTQDPGNTRRGAEERGRGGEEEAIMSDLWQEGGEDRVVCTDPNPVSSATIGGSVLTLTLSLVL